MIETRIVCDRCMKDGMNTEGVVVGPAYKIRKHLRAKGWKCFSPYDICPECYIRSPEYVEVWKLGNLRR